MTKAWEVSVEEAMDAALSGKETVEGYDAYVLATEIKSLRGQLHTAKQVASLWKSALDLQIERENKARKERENDHQVPCEYRGF